MRGKLDMQHLRKLPHYILTGLLFVASALQGTNVIFDLGGVLIDTNKSAATRQLGLGNILTYFFSTGKASSAIKQKLYEILYKLDSVAINSSCAHDHDGQLLPALMCDWMTGAQTPKEILHIVVSAIDNNPDWFVTKSEKKLVRNIARMMFTPKRFAKTRELIKDGIKFLQQCKQAGHNIYILSNWDAESIDVLQNNNKQFKKFIDLCDGVAISAKYGVMKPNKKFYKNLLSKYRLTPSDCVFFDDQLENIEAAQQLGMHGIRVVNKNFKDAQQAFRHWEQHKQLTHLVWV